MRTTLLGITSALILVTGAASQASACFDVAIVLAVDGSDSIDDEEYAFQKAAISAAFRDKAVISALREAGVVAVSAVFWGDANLPTQELDWFVIDRGDGTESFAREIENNHRVVFGNTDIGNGIWSALTLLSGSSLCARTSIVDISGDGRETLGPKRSEVISLYQARRRAKQMDVTINALVVSDEGDLASYYAKKVIVGPGAFVMDIRSYADYSDAIRKKLIRELSYRAVDPLR